MSLLDFLYPKHCPICLDVLPPGKQLICEPCKKKIRYVKEPVCMSCGKPLDDCSKEYCRNCDGKEHPWIRGFAYAEYTSKYIRRMLSEVKYHEHAQLLDYPCKDFAEREKERIKNFQCEVLIPVPVHKKRLRERGYNQAEEMASRLSEVWKIPVDGKYLLRKEYTEAQKKLSKDERLRNLRRAFCSDGEYGKYKRVILVDDIFTTGSTMEACCEVLKEKGVAEIYFAVLAIGHDYSS